MGVSCDVCYNNILLSVLSTIARLSSNNRTATFPLNIHQTPMRTSLAFVLSSSITLPHELVVGFAREIVVTSSPFPLHICTKHARVSACTTRSRVWSKVGTIETEGDVYAYVRRLSVRWKLRAE